MKKEGRVHCGSEFEGILQNQSRDVMAQEFEVPVTCVHSLEAEEDKCLYQLTILFVESQIPVHGAVLYRFMVNLSISANPI